MKSLVDLGSRIKYAHDFVKTFLIPAPAKERPRAELRFIGFLLSGFAVFDLFEAKYLGYDRGSIFYEFL